MPVSADTHIILDMHSPKKDAVVGEGVPTVPDGSVAIWANALTTPCFTTDAVATWQMLYARGMDGLKDTDVEQVISSAIDASAVDVQAAPPGAGDVGLYIGADMATGNKSHYVRRTFMRVLEVWLELAKDGCGDTPARRGFIIEGDDNHWDFGGQFWSGDDVDIQLKITDPDGLEEEDHMVLTLPNLPGGNVIYNPQAVAELVCQMIAALVHYRCARTGTAIDIGPAAPANSVQSNLTAILQ